MQGNIVRIKQLQKMIAEREELLQDETAIALLGEDGVEAIKHFIKLYKEKLDKLSNASSEHYEYHKYYGVRSRVYDNGRVTCQLTNIEFYCKPINLSFVKSDYDLHFDWFDTYEQAWMFACQITCKHPRDMIDLLVERERYKQRIILTNFITVIMPLLIVIIMKLIIQIMIYTILIII